MKATAAISALLVGLTLSGTADAKFYYRYTEGGGKVAAGEPVEEAAPNASCKTILDNGNSTGNGVYDIDPDGDGVTFPAYCDMTTAGGGWTMVAAQFEHDPVTNWGEGIQGDYDPSLASGKSFTLDAARIPSHSQTAFGANLDPTYADYADFVYSTGDISTRVAGIKHPANQYDIHRNSTCLFAAHDPDGDGGASCFYNGVDGVNTLTFDRVAAGTYDFTWSFGPTDLTPGNKGYAMLGNRTGSMQSYA